jgi:hypothetical protein
MASPARPPTRGGRAGLRGPAGVAGTLRSVSFNPVP